VVPRLDRSRYHIVERIAQLLLPFGIDPWSCDLRLEYPISDSERQWAETILGKPRGAYRLGINIAASHPDKYWGRTNWIAFIQAVQRRYPDAEPLLFAPPTYAAEQQAIAEATGVRQVPPTASFHEFAVVLGQCDVIVTPDTAAAHLAAAWQRPCLALYVWDNPALMPWFPYRSPYEAAFTRRGALKYLPVEDAIAALERLLHRIEQQLPRS
jgi:ADP-heptose:LPS heptosyltransferase